MLDEARREQFLEFISRKCGGPFGHEAWVKALRSLHARVTRTGNEQRMIPTDFLFQTTALAAAQ